MDSFFAIRYKYKVILYFRSPKNNFPYLKSGKCDNQVKIITVPIQKNKAHLVKRHFRYLHLFLSILTLLCGIQHSNELLAQGDKTGEMAKLYVAEKYVDIIHLSTRIEGREPNADECFFIGLAYFNIQEDKAALTFFEIASRLRKDEPDVWFHKALCLLHLERYEEALEAINKTIAIVPTNADYWTTKADILYGVNELDSALVYYKKVMEKEGFEERFYLIVAQIYELQNEQSKAIDAYYVAKDSLTEAISYQHCLYNLGGLLFQQKLYKAALSVMWELVDLVPEDLEARVKLMQIYYGLGEYEKGASLKQKLYHAYENDDLPKTLEEDFCFDQFEVLGKKVMAFERYKESRTEKRLYKHVFYVLDSVGNVDYTVQTAQSYAVILADKAYQLSSDKGGEYVTYADFVFDENTPYSDLKKAVTSVIDGTAKSNTTSFKNENNSFLKIEPSVESEPAAKPAPTTSPKLKKNKKSKEM